MWADVEDAEIFIYPHNRSNTCQHCGERRPNYHFFEPDDPETAFVECLYDRAETNLIKAGNSGDLIDAGQKINLIKLYETAVNKGVSPPEDLHKIMVDHLLSYFRDWDVVMNNAGFTVPPVIKARSEYIIQVRYPKTNSH